MAKTVTITFDQDTGDATVDLDGFNGKGCRAIAKAFSNAIGVTASSEDKPEAFRESNVSCLTNG
jgi:hypothetical protein